MHQMQLHKNSHKCLAIFALAKFRSNIYSLIYIFLSRMETISEIEPIANKPYVSHE